MLVHAQFVGQARRDAGHLVGMAHQIVVHAFNGSAQRGNQGFVPCVIDQLVAAELGNIRKNGHAAADF